MALVFPAFKKRPDAFPNVLMVLTVYSNEFLSPSNVISVSSAYCEILYSVSSIKIPFICLFCLIIMASISTHKINSLLLVTRLPGRSYRECLRSLLLWS